MKHNSLPWSSVIWNHHPKTLLFLVLSLLYLHLHCLCPSFLVSTCITEVLIVLSLPSVWPLFPLLPASPTFSSSWPKLLIHYFTDRDSKVQTWKCNFLDEKNHNRSNYFYLFNPCQRTRHGIQKRHHSSGYDNYLLYLWCNSFRLWHLLISKIF